MTIHPFTAFIVGVLVGAVAMYFVVKRNPNIEKAIDVEVKTGGMK